MSKKLLLGLLLVTSAASCADQKQLTRSEQEAVNFFYTSIGVRVVVAINDIIREEIIGRWAATLRTPLTLSERLWGIIGKTPDRITQQTAYYQTLYNESLATDRTMERLYYVYTGCKMLQFTGHFVLEKFEKRVTKKMQGVNCGSFAGRTLTRETPKKTNPTNDTPQQTQYTVFYQEGKWHRKHNNDTTEPIIDMTDKDKMLIKALNLKLN